MIDNEKENKINEIESRAQPIGSITYIFDENIISIEVIGQTITSSGQAIGSEGINSLPINKVNLKNNYVLNTVITSSKEFEIRNITENTFECIDNNSGMVGGGTTTLTLTSKKKGPSYKPISGGGSSDNTKLYVHTLTIDQKFYMFITNVSEKILDLETFINVELIIPCFSRLNTADLINANNTNFLLFIEKAGSKTQIAFIKLQGGFQGVTGATFSVLNISEMTIDNDKVVPL